MKYIFLIQQQILCERVKRFKRERESKFVFITFNDQIESHGRVFTCTEGTLQEANLGRIKNKRIQVNEFT